MDQEIGVVKTLAAGWSHLCVDKFVCTVTTGANSWQLRAETGRAGSKIDESHKRERLLTH